MKKRNKILMTLLFALAMVEAVVNTVCATTLGADYTIMGFPAGWILVIIGVVVGALFVFKLLKVPEKLTGVVALILIVMILVGLAMVFVETPAEITEASGLSTLEFSIEAEALTTDGTYYPDTTYDESSGMFTIPYRSNLTGDSIYEHGDNSSYTDHPVLNFTIKADFDDATDDDLAKIHYEITNPSQHVGTDTDNYVLIKKSNEFMAWWIDQDAGNSTVTGYTSGGIEETLWVNLHMQLYGAGLSQADLLEPTVLNIKFSNPAGTWSETFTVQFISTHEWGA